MTATWREQMDRDVLYVAHPVAPTESQMKELPLSESSLREAQRQAAHHNLARGQCWLQWLRRSFPETTFIAPWISTILSGGDETDPKQREAGLIDDCAVVERCDGIVLCGGRISTGMALARDHGVRNSWWALEYGDPDAFQVYDLTPEKIDHFIRYPTWSVLEGAPPFHEWYQTLKWAAPL